MSYSMEDEQIEKSIKIDNMVNNLSFVKSCINILKGEDTIKMDKASLILKECQDKLDLILTGED
jgi:hypothetical protein